MIPSRLRPRSSSISSNKSGPVLSPLAIDPAIGDDGRSDLGGEPPLSPDMQDSPASFAFHGHSAIDTSQTHALSEELQRSKQLAANLLKTIARFERRLTDLDKIIQPVRLQTTDLGNLQGNLAASLNRLADIRDHLALSQKLAGLASGTLPTGTLPQGADLTTEHIFTFSNTLKTIWDAASALSQTGILAVNEVDDLRRHYSSGVRIIRNAFSQTLQSSVRTGDDLIGELARQAIQHYRTADAAANVAAPEAPSDVNGSPSGSNDLATPARPGTARPLLTLRTDNLDTLTEEEVSWFLEHDLNGLVLESVPEDISFCRLQPANGGPRSGVASTRRPGATTGSPPLLIHERSVPLVTALFVALSAFEKTNALALVQYHSTERTALQGPASRGPLFGWFSGSSGAGAAGATDGAPGARAMHQAVVLAALAASCSDFLPSPTLYMQHRNNHTRAIFLGLVHHFAATGPVVLGGHLAPGRPDSRMPASISQADALLADRGPRHLVFQARAVLEFLFLERDLAILCLDRDNSRICFENIFTNISSLYTAYLESYLDTLATFRRACLAVSRGEDVPGAIGADPGRLHPSLLGPTSTVGGLIPLSSGPAVTVAASAVQTDGALKRSVKFAAHAVAASSAAAAKSLAHAANTASERVEQRLHSQRAGRFLGGRRGSTMSFGEDLPDPLSDGLLQPSEAGRSGNMGVLGGGSSGTGMGQSGRSARTSSFGFRVAGPVPAPGDVAVLAATLALSEARSALASLSTHGVPMIARICQLVIESHALLRHFEELSLFCGTYPQRVSYLMSVSLKQHVHTYFNDIIICIGQIACNGVLPADGTVHEHTNDLTILLRSLYESAKLVEPVLSSLPHLDLRSNVRGTPGVPLGSFVALCSRRMLDHLQTASRAYGRQSTFDQFGSGFDDHDAPATAPASTGRFGRLARSGSSSSISSISSLSSVAGSSGGGGHQSSSHARSATIASLFILNNVDHLRRFIQTVAIPAVASPVGGADTVGGSGLSTASGSPTFEEDALTAEAAAPGYRGLFAGNPSLAATGLEESLKLLDSAFGTQRAVYLAFWAPLVEPLLNATFKAPLAPPPPASGDFTVLDKPVRKRVKALYTAFNDRLKNMLKVHDSSMAAPRESVRRALREDVRRRVVAAYRDFTQYYPAPRFVTSGKMRKDYLIRYIEWAPESLDARLRQLFEKSVGVGGAAAASAAVQDTLEPL